MPKPPLRTIFFPKTFGSTRTNAGAEVLFIRVIEVGHFLDRTIDEALGAEDIIAEQTVLFRNRREVFPAQAEVTVKFGLSFQSSWTNRA